jgi:hypothetical protein
VGNAVKMSYAADLSLASAHILLLGVQCGRESILFEVVFEVVQCFKWCSV